MREPPKRRSPRPARETPVLGPRRRPTRVRPATPTQPRRYHAGVAPPRKDDWIDEGGPEVNG